MPSTVFAPAGHMRVDPGRKWRDVPPRDLYPQGMAFEQDAELLYWQVRTRCPADADGVLMVGTGLRCVGVLEALEQDLRKPVVPRTKPASWHCLRLSKVNTPVKGYGNLLLI